MVEPTDVPEITDMLPCPFDGGEAYVQSHEGMFFVGCMTCYCNVGEAYDNCAVPEHMFRSREDAIGAWNQRTPAASPVAPDETDATERMRKNLEKVAKDVAGWSEAKRANAEAIMYPENRLNPPLASPVAGGSARIAEIASRLAAATPGPWQLGEPSSVNHNLYAEDGTLIAGVMFRAKRGLSDPLPEDYYNAAFIAAAPDDIAHLLIHLAELSEQYGIIVDALEDTQNHRAEGWVKVTPETMPPENLIVEVYQLRGWAKYKNSRWLAVDECGNESELAWTPQYWVHRPYPAPPAAEEERSSL